MPYDLTHLWNLVNKSNYSKQNGDRLIESGMTAIEGGILGGRRIKQKGKRTHGQQCGDCRRYKGAKWQLKKYNKMFSKR